jgi:RimJ/RimL family protein N-acetyltransferase
MENERHSIPALTNDAISLIEGARVALSPAGSWLLPYEHRWANDLETSRTLGLSWPESMDQTVDRIARRNAQDAVWFTVLELPTRRPVGTTHLEDIDLRHNRATFGIVIGEGNARGRGLGTEATRLTLAYAFEHLGLSNVMLTVYEHNLGGITA